MPRVAIIGAGHTRFGRRPDATVQHLAFEAFREAIQDASIDQKRIDGVAVGSVPEYHKQRSLAGAIATHLQLMPAPVWLTEAACGSGGAAIRVGWLAVRSGAHKIVAVLGCQKMTELGTADIQSLMGRVGDVRWETPHGTTFPAYYALFARRHMFEHGTTPEQLALIASKNHHYGVGNPLAMFRKEVSVSDVLASPMVASPLHLFDCCANADGAACLILCDEPTAKALDPNRPRVWLDGCGAAGGSMSVLTAGELTSVPATRDAARQAYDQAGCTARDIHVAQVHDGFTITELMAYEDLGFCDRGQGGRFIEARQPYLDGPIPINVDGGIKAKGHPIGATGVSMAVELVRQLRGECGPRQVTGASLGLMQNVGGIGQYVFVNVLRRET
jgi:acetyl-CoA C-acetyltransferase